MAVPSAETITLCCYTCWGAAISDGLPYLCHPEAWPVLECPFTPGCPGRLVPEALN